MGVYIPPCGNVESSVNVCVCDIATVCATEVLAVPNANVTAFMASLRSICRGNGSDLNAIYLALVFKERTELIEIPYYILYKDFLLSHSCKIKTFPYP